MATPEPVHDAQPQGPASTPPEASSAGYLEELKNLAELRDSGVITEEEFEAKKKQILGL